ncbi:MAG: GerW family sporulation protein [Hydrogenibacillus sp.]|nr:GerW family sporulation protein [Hydrogenibacillus sp.]
MDNHPIEGLMAKALDNIKGMVDVSTIIGEPIVTPDGSTILPISKVGFGFVAGGTEFDPGTSQDAELPFGGGSGGGVSIQPVGFLVVGRTDVRFIPLEPTVHLYDRLIDFAPKAFDKLNALIRGTQNGGQDRGAQGAQKGSKRVVQVETEEEEA